jgi:hypothetical protein
LWEKDIMATISINLIVPQGWHELDDKQLRYVYSLIAKEFSADEIKTLTLLHFSGCKVIARHDKNSFLLKHGKDVFQTSGTLIAEVIPSLGWLDAIPASPVRLKKLRNHASVDAEFQGVPFETYIVVENLYQGFLSTQKDALLDDLAHVLYPGCSATLTPRRTYQHLLLGGFAQRYVCPTFSRIFFSRLPPTLKTCSAVHRTSANNSRSRWTLKFVPSLKVTSQKKRRFFRSILGVL